VISLAVERLCAFTFASRQAYRLAYRCQREQPHDRALRRAFKLRDKLGGIGGIGGYIPKLKWMRWRTYERAMARIDKAKEVVDAYTDLMLDRLKQTGSISKIGGNRIAGGAEAE
jgi:hypothetical protein